MRQRIACYTLFDITKTGVLNRARPGDDVADISDWYKKRNTQCNFDTILQIVSLRTQPDLYNDPKCIQVLFDENCNFGEKYKDNKYHKVWTFDFDIQHLSVFDDGNNELGHLYNDCQNVPMILSDTMEIDIGNVLDCDKFSRNIYFVKY